MAETIDLANDSVLVTDPADTDRVAIMRGPSPKTVTLADLAKAVRSTIAAPGRNLLVGSNTPNNKPNDYQMCKFSYGSETPRQGGTYTLTAKVTFGTKGIISFYWDGGTNVIKKFIDVPGSTKVISACATCRAILQKPYMGIFQGTNLDECGSDSEIHWAVLAEGNIPSGAWVPAPEDLQNSGGGKTLCLNAFCLNAA